MGSNMAALPVSMFWKLVVNKYQEWKLHHILMLIILFLYSLIGAVCFVSFEQPNEIANRESAIEEARIRSKEARKEFFKEMWRLAKNANNSKSTLLRLSAWRKLLSEYDRKMGFEVEEAPLKWTMWGGLYYAGTVYTTIGYGDIATETLGGRLFTMVYALVGIPLVVTVLNDYGTLLFNVLQRLWLRVLRRFTKLCKSSVNKQQDDIDSLLRKSSGSSESKEQNEPIPLKIALGLLVFWILLCATVFCFFEDWTLFESIYFFVISLTTIGFGDLSPQHKVAVANFLLILAGLSVVSMSINVIQAKIELMFEKMVQSIDSDFKQNLGASTEQSLEKQKSVQETEVVAVKVDGYRGKPDASRKEGSDFVEEYGKSVRLSDKLLLKLMSRHQKQMLNKRYEEKSKMRNRGTQTVSKNITASVQTDEIKKLSDLQMITAGPNKDDETDFGSRKHYIYSIGE